MADREPDVRNDAVRWSDFDAAEYWKNNYASVLPEDAEIIQCASKFLSEACGDPARVLQAVDVGAGTNLYPALLMLPWAAHIVFTEYASQNIDWLSQNLAERAGDWRWQPFWELIADLPPYRTVADPRAALAAAHEVQTASIFDLPKRSWDLGTMFFVADGMTTDVTEFKAAVRAFIDALRPESPFLMAFMENSASYPVGDRQYPSVRVTQRSLDELLAGLPVYRTSVLRTDNTIRSLRPGYDAMLLVTGFVAMGLGTWKGPRWHK
jgi:NNMT/PNMT/TEMT family